MHIEGSCYCGAVRFSCDAYAPAPYLRCYCSICRKTGGGGGYAINLGARADTLQVAGEHSIAVFHATIDGERTTTERRFCKQCGSALWVWSPDWPDLVHPFASAVDTPLPAAPEHVHMMLGSKADWVPVDDKPGEARFDAYPTDSLEDWHREHCLMEEHRPRTNSRKTKFRRSSRGKKCCRPGPPNRAVVVKSPLSGAT